jgi:hypothetical protein
VQILNLAGVKSQICTAFLEGKREKAMPSILSVDREKQGENSLMKIKSMQEMNEQFKDCPQRENRYTVDGQPVIVVSHFIGNKDLNEVLYQNAFDKALNEVLNTPIQSSANV